MTLSLETSCFFNICRKMNGVKWTDLEKGACSNHFQFKIESAYGSPCANSINFSHCAFDTNDEALVAIDNNGIAYYIDMSGVPAYKKLGCVGLSTFVSFHPKDRNLLLIGLSSTNIKVVKITAIDDFCLLTGHTGPPNDIAFYKDYFLTYSSNEVFVWQCKIYCKMHQLRLNDKNIIIKKALFSSSGLIAILYQSNVIQIWGFQQFDKDNRVDPEKNGLKNVKDFEFTKDGRAMVVCGCHDKILVYNTTTWDLVKSIYFLENYNGGRQISIVPLPLDGGANSIVAVLTTDCVLRFISLASSRILENCCDSPTGIRRIKVSQKGKFLTCVTKDGTLEIICIDKLIKMKLNCSEEKLAKAQKKIPLHKLEDDLRCVQNAVKEELRLSRLMPILKEYGEYPEKHRKLIWSVIMELPENRRAYIDLSDKVPHEAMFELLKNDPLLEKCKSSLLATTLSCLLHWCPVLAECSYLPRLIMPFTNVFQKNPILAFESSLYILQNYCQKWFEYHPLPPLNILGIIENALLDADPALFNYFCEKGVTSGDYAWPLLQSLLSEVLIASDWLILWDHLLSLRKPSLLLLCIVAYNISYRKTIMSRLQCLDDFRLFYKTQGHVSVKVILKILNKLDGDTPTRIHPRRYLKNDPCILPRSGPYPPFLQHEFPMYLTDELRGLNLKKMKEKERRLRGLQLHALELLEEKRLRLESENFMRNIHETRLNELRRFYENQVREDERFTEYAKKETEDLDPSRYLDDDFSWTDLRLNGRSASAVHLEKRRRCRSKSRKYKSLQEQVDRLEYEIHNLLTLLQSRSRSRSKSRSRME